ncbi:MAG: hypothetical protein IJ523_04935 [Succinivibrionaceae bacterium]|nr:hypothetical protein [Succinivibrionaceae bacterium]
MERTDLMFLLPIISHVICFLACLVTGGFLGRAVFDTGSGRWHRGGSRRHFHSGGLAPETQALFFALVFNCIIVIVALQGFEYRKLLRQDFILSFEMSADWWKFWLLTFDALLDCLIIFCLYVLNRVNLLLPLAVPLINFASCSVFGPILAELNRNGAEGGEGLASLLVPLVYFIVAAALFAFLAHRTITEPDRIRREQSDLEEALDAQEQNGWYDFQHSPYASLAGDETRVQGFCAWNRERFAQLGGLNVTDELLESLFFALGGFALESQGKDPQLEIWFDEILARLGIDDARADRARELVREGRQSRQNVLDQVAETGIRAEIVSHNLMKTVFSLMATAMFFDLTLKETRRRTFYSVARACGLSKYEADAVFSAHIRVFRLNYDPATGDYSRKNSAGSDGSMGDKDLEEACLTLLCSPGDAKEDLKRAWQSLADRYRAGRIEAMGADSPEGKRIARLAREVDRACSVVRSKKML